jgi:murein DD-endopeptidase MepM/ murein hydrolase activator NlpD
VEPSGRVRPAGPNRALRATLAVAIATTILPGSQSFGAAAGAGIPAVSAGVSAASPSLVPPPSYYRPVVMDGMTFPVARSNFLSLIRFRNDWHAPRLRLVDRTWRLIGVHEGIDIAAEPGTPLVAMTSGVVEAVGWTFYSGTRVGIRGADGRYYFYAHLSSVAPGIAAGVAVSPGELLGRVGNTGYGEPGHRDEFPPHLHFGIQDGPEWVSPYASLARLYDAAVRKDAQGQRALDSLAAEGKTEAWRTAAAELYTDFGLPMGE